jgi:FMN phosphatase YigB (HAD superfamily)
MPVYVDSLFVADRRNAEGFEWCHMFADSLDELHAMAKTIGRNRCWFHRGDHYDLTPSFRAKAIAAGATELTWRQVVPLRPRRDEVKGG